MTNPLITTDEAQQADLLATIEDTEYRALSVVYKLNGSGSAAFYCSMRDWPQTEAGRLARYTAEIERLRAENEGLRASLLLQRSHPITVEEALEITAPILTCPHCGKGPFRDKRGLAGHTRIKHRGGRLMQTADERQRRQQDGTR